MAGIDLILRYNSSRRVRTEARKRGPLLGCNRVGVGKPEFVPVRMHPATGCGCDPLAEGPFAGADALRPVSPMSIAALCAPSRTGATRTGSGAHPRARGAPHGGRGASCMGIWPGRCAWIRLRSSAPTFGSANASPQAGPLLHAAPNPCSAVRGRASLQLAPRLSQLRHSC